MTFATLALLSDAWDSPFIVPVAGCLTGLGIACASIYSGMKKRELESQERLAAIAKGIALPVEDIGLPAPDGTRKRNGARQGGIVLCGLAIGLMLFFMAMAHIVQQREVLAGAAASLIPLGIGVGLLIDARIRTRELEAAPPSTDSTR